MRSNGDHPALSLIRRAVGALAASPVAFDALRWILEAGYRGEKEVIRREGLRDRVRILDLGCGTGALAGAFEPAMYLGIDPNHQYIARARRLHPEHRFAVMDGCALALPSDTFGVVLISGVIHHIETERALDVLRETKRVLKVRAGRLVMWEDVPVRRSSNIVGRLIHRLDEGDHIRSDAEYIHLTEMVFGAVHSYPMSSGVCDYVVISASSGGARLPD